MRPCRMPSGPGKTIHKMLASNDRFRNGLPERLPDGFTLTKTNGDPSHYAVCEVWTHPAGWELRLTINGRILPIMTIVESADQMRSMVEKWKAVMVEKGWGNGGT